MNLYSKTREMMAGGSFLPPASLNKNDPERILKEKLERAKEDIDKIKRETEALSDALMNLFFHSVYDPYTMYRLYNENLTYDVLEYKVKPIGTEWERGYTVLINNNLSILYRIHGASEHSGTEESIWIYWLGDPVFSCKHQMVKYYGGTKKIRNYYQNHLYIKGNWEAELFEAIGSSLGGGLSKNVFAEAIERTKKLARITSLKQEISRLEKVYNIKVRDDGSVTNDPVEIEIEKYRDDVFKKMENGEVHAL